MREGERVEQPPLAARQVGGRMRHALGFPKIDGPVTVTLLYLSGNIDEYINERLFGVDREHDLDSSFRDLRNHIGVTGRESGENGIRAGAPVDLILRIDGAIPKESF